MHQLNEHTTGVPGSENARLPIRKILIANRGEIALRIQRTAATMGIKTVAVFDAADRDSAFVKNADESVFLEGLQLGDTYLHIEKMIAAAQSTRCDAIHPGYGFLSENSAFVRACEKAGLIFIGPGAEAMEAMGNKISARRTAVNAGVPVTPGLTGSVNELLRDYTQIGFPVLIKAAAGGGGKGMRIVQDEAEFPSALEATAREARNYFGDDTVYLEKYIQQPRHIEVQVLGDQQGHMIHLFERECSLQRRHQKIVEESPAIAVSEPLRQQICAAAIALARSIGYYNAGTMEFLVDDTGQFYFLEMNTRIQVEHPVTELTTGLDIVELQIRIACGVPLPFGQADIRQRGHAIECRIYAEDPRQQFRPSPGLLSVYEEPLARAGRDGEGPVIRIDGMALTSKDRITGDFDPMISKLIVWDTTREAALQTMLDALQQYQIKGIQTNLELLIGLMQHPDFKNNQISTKYIDTRLNQILTFIDTLKAAAPQEVLLAAALAKSLEARPDPASIWQQIGYWRHSRRLQIQVAQIPVTVEGISLQDGTISFMVNGIHRRARLGHLQGIRYSLRLDQTDYLLCLYSDQPGRYHISYEGLDHTVIRPDISGVDQQVFEPATPSDHHPQNISAPMPGKVIKVNVRAGDLVQKGDTLLIVESMKMENNILSHINGVVETVEVQPGDKVDANRKLVQLKSAPQ